MHRNLKSKMASFSVLTNSSKSPNPSKTTWFRSLAYAIVGALAFAQFMSDYRPYLGLGSSLSIGIHILGLCVLGLVLGCRWGWALTGYGIIWALLTKIDITKQREIIAPLNLFDLKIALADLGGLFSAIGMPVWFGNFIYSVFAVLLLGLVWRRYFRRRAFLGAVAKLAFDGVLVVLLSRAYGVAFDKAGEFIGQQFLVGRIDVDELPRRRRALGLLPYMAWYQYNANSNVGPYESAQLGIDGGPLDEFLQKFSQNTLAKLPAVPAKLPNIIVILNESLFDAAATFDISVPSQTMFYGTKNSITGSLLINTIGGGTWRSEYSMIAGVDHRVFGFRGDYAPVNLAGISHVTFPKYLNQLGYQTHAIYPVPGNFYASRSAYRGYGFQRFEDVREVGLADDWKLNSDERIYDTVYRRYGELKSGGKPVMLMALTVVNHAPYVCTPDTPKLVNDKRVDEDGNCQLNAYLAKISITNTALNKFVQRVLAEDDNAMILNFGDHQPFTLTRGTMDKLRRPTTLAPSDRLTFFRLDVSPQWQPMLSFWPNHMNIAALPTWLSFMFKRTIADSYLPENLWVESRCQSDALRCSDADLAQYLQSLKARKFLNQH